MNWNDAIKLHNEDEVIVKETGAAMSVVDVKVYTSVHRMDVMLTDGNWYSYKDIR